MTNTAINTNDRSYLFGRLMAIHEYIAFCAERDDIRVSRLHDKYVAHPKTTFAKIETEIMPDMYANLSDKIYDKVMDIKSEIVSALVDNGYSDDSLTEMYLLGYYLEFASIRS